MKGKEYDIYCAGLFDGEGGIYMSGRKVKDTIIVTMTNTNRRLCVLFSDCYEGLIHKSQPKNPNAHTIYRWSLHGKKAKHFLLSIQPFSIEKSLLIHLALEYLSLIGRIKEPGVKERRKEISEAIYSANSSKGRYARHHMGWFNEPKDYCANQTIMVKSLASPVIRKYQS